MDVDIVDFILDRIIITDAWIKPDDPRFEPRNSRLVRWHPVLSRNRGAVNAGPIPPLTEISRNPKT
jgi:hypothetical protein